MTAETMARRGRGILVALAFVGFISLGLPDGLLGVAWPSIARTLAVSLDSLGLLLACAAGGYLISSFSSGRLLAMISVGSLLALSCLATAGAVIGFATLPFWWLLLPVAMVLGAGGGAIDSALNTYAAQRFSPRLVNWLHACYGIGATLGPAIMTTVIGSGLPWQLGYLIVGSAQLVLTLCFALTRERWGAAGPGGEHAHTAPATMLATLRLPAAWIGFVLFLIYTGLEVSAGQWAFSLLTLGRRLPAVQAGAFVTLYWGALTVGRILAGLVAHRFTTGQLLRGSMLGATLGTALIWINLGGWSSGLGLALLGVALAPIFPTLIAETPARLGAAHTANAIGVQVSLAVVGGALLPAVIGIASRAVGLEVIGLALLLMALSLAGLNELGRRAEGRL